MESQYQYYLKSFYEAYAHTNLQPLSYQDWRDHTSRIYNLSQEPIAPTYSNSYNFPMTSQQINEDNEIRTSQTSHDSQNETSANNKKTSTTAPTYSNSYNFPMPSQQVGEDNEIRTTQKSRDSQNETSANNKKTSTTTKATRKRWERKQTNVLVAKWKEYFNEIESAGANAAWAKIKSCVDQAGEEKTVQQCKNKIKNLKDEYKKAKDHNSRTGNSPIYPPFFHEIDEVYSTRDVVNMPNLAEVGATSSTATESNSEISTNVSDDEEWEDFMKEYNKRDGGSKKQPGKKKKEKSFHEKMLELQQEQLKQQAEREERQQKFMREMFEEQRRLDREEKEKERDFFLKLGEMFSK